MGEPVYILKKKLVGALAFCAVRQSPYVVPPNLVDVLLQFDERIKERFTLAQQHNQGMACFDTLREFRGFIEAHLKAIPELMAWNERKNGRRGPGFVSAQGSDASGPDDDFVDIDALVTNVVLECTKD